MNGPIKASVITMHHHRQIWRGVGEIVKKHGSLPHSAFWEHYFDVYAESQAMAVRRQTDLHRDTASLAKLVSELREDAELLTSEWWIGLWEIEDGDEHTRARAQGQWDDAFGGKVGTYLDPSIPKADLERLREGSQAVKKYVDKHIAHSEYFGPGPKDSAESSPGVILTLNELDDAIDMIGEIFCRYFSLLEAASMIDLEPAIQHDWLAPFREPWIRSEP